MESRDDRPAHPRIRYVLGSSVTPDTVEQVRRMVAPGAKVMVVLDSDHSYEHVSSELITYADFVSVDSYLICEDTNVTMAVEAVAHFLQRDGRFQADASR